MHVWRDFEEEGGVLYILTLPNGGLYDGQSRFQQLNWRSRDVVLAVVLLSLIHI